MERTVGFLLVGMVGTVLSFAPLPTRAATNEQLEAVSQAVLDMAVSQGTVQAASVGLSFSDSTTWAGASGYSDSARTTAASPTDQYRVGSFSKTFNGTVILRLVDRGIIKLTDTVDQWLPDLNLTNGNTITVENLLQMTSGVPEYLGAPSSHVQGETVLQEWENFSSSTGPYGYASYTPSELVEAAERLKFGTIGTMSYSNTNFALLGMIAEKASCLASSGCSTIESMVNTLMSNLGLATISFPTTSAFTGSYVQNAMVDTATGKVYDMTSANPMVPWAAGAIIGTPADLAAWTRELATNAQGTLSAATFAQRISDLALGEVSGISSRYGLAIYVMPSPGTGGYVIGHSGLLAGYTSSEFYDPALDIAIVVNVSGSGSDNAASWFPLYGFESTYGSAIREGGFNALPIYWAIDRNLTVAQMASGSCNWDASSSFTAGTSGTCDGVNARLSGINVDHASLTVNPSGQTIGNLIVSGDWYRYIATAAPSLSFFGSGLNGIALTGGATVSIPAGAIVEMTGPGSSAIASSGNDNVIIVNGSILVYGADTKAISGAAGAESVTIGSTATVLGGIDLGGGADRLRIDGVVTGDVPLGADARLDGVGHVIGTVEGGTVAPGDGSGHKGTLTVTNYIADGSTLVIGIAPDGGVDRLIATGTADLSGGSLHVATDRSAPDTLSTIVSAGTASGTFSSVTADGGGVAAARVGSDTVKLATVNPVLVDAGAALSRVGLSHSLTSIARQAFVQGSAPATSTAMLDFTQTAADLGLDAGATDALSAFAAQPIDKTYPGGVRLWTDVGRFNGRIVASANLPSRTLSGIDFNAGGEFPLNERFRVGLSFGHQVSKATWDQGSARSVSFLGGVYGAVDLDAVTLSAQLEGGRGNVRTKRQVNVDGTMLTATARRPDTRLAARLAASRDIDIGKAILRPEFSVAYADILPDDAVETGGGDADLRISKGSSAIVRPEISLSLRGDLPFDDADGHPRLKGEMHAGLAREFAVRDEAAEVVPVGLATSMRLESAERRVLSVPVGAKLTARFGHGIDGFVSYDGEFSATTVEHNLGFGLRMTW